MFVKSAFIYFFYFKYFYIVKQQLLNLGRFFYTGLLTLKILCKLHAISICVKTKGLNFLPISYLYIFYSTNFEPNYCGLLRDADTYMIGIFRIQ